MADTSSLIEQIRAGLDKLKDWPGYTLLSDFGGQTYLTPDNIRRLLDHIAELEAKTEWRDIESAPRNGQRFLAHIEGVDRAVMIYWNGGEWSTVDGNDWTGRSLLAWLPLPPPPSAHGGRDNG